MTIARAGGILARAALAAAWLFALIPSTASASLAIGRCETFESGLADWTVAASGSALAEVNTLTASSGTHSLTLRSGIVSVTSDPVDLSGGLTITLTAWVRRGGFTDSDRPEPPDSLTIEYLASSGTWTELVDLKGGNASGAVLPQSFALPSDALYSSFQIRFRQTGGKANDDYWHVDDVCLTGNYSWYGLDETSWTGASGEVLDGGGNGRDGTVFGGATNAQTTPALAGNPGTCEYGTFDGADDYVEIPDDARLDLPDAVTVAAWVRMRSTPSDLYTIASKDTNYEFHIDSGRHVYWWWNDSSGNTRSITTTATIALNTWVHIAVTYASGTQKIYINGAESGSASYTGTLATNDLPFYIGTDWNFISRAFDGYIDEVYVIPEALGAAQVVQLKNKRHACASVSAQFTLNHDGFGINCVPETITVNVIDANAGTPLTSYNAQVQLDTGTGAGTWTLVTGSGAFSDGAANDGVATYTWPLGQSQAVFALSYAGTAGVQTINNIEVTQVGNSGIRDNNADGPLTFAPNGFTVTAAPLSNPPPGTIATFGGSQMAGTSFNLYITAYGQTPNDPVCGVIEAYTGTKSLKFWSSYANPATGTIRPTITTSAGTFTAAASVGTATGQNVTFANGQTVVAAKYKDVGQIAIAMRDDATTDATQLPNGINGATADFVVKPYDFVFSAIRNGGGTVANPQAASAAGDVFIAAGTPFRVTVTVTDAEGSTTPNYGKEATPETVRLISSLVDPAGGANPAVGKTVGFGAFSNGVATGADFSWSEVGIIQLRGGIGDADYLLAGDVTGASVSERVGRFTPHHFSTALNTPSFTTGCSSGTFTYAAQPFGFGTAPVITAIPVALGGTTTANYTGGYFKLATSTLSNRSYVSGAGTLDTTGLPPTSSDPVVAPVGGGNATLTFGTGTGLKFTKVALAPFQAGIRLSIDVQDGDGVAATNPVSFGASSGIAFTAGQEIRYGRVRLANALGSERVDLPVKMVAEYYASSSVGFVTNSVDSCTTNVSLALSNYTDALGAGETCARDAGVPGASGVGCAAIAANRYQEPPAAGDFNLRLAAPGAGNQGSVVVTATVPAWLRFDWSGAGEQNPSGQATFGIFGGESRQIYTREIY